MLDPIFALRTVLRLERGQSASVAFTTIVATSREHAFELADRYHDPHAAQRALDLAWTSTQVELRELGITPGGSKSQLFKARGRLRKLLAHLVDAPGAAPGRDRDHAHAAAPHA